MNSGDKIPQEEQQCESPQAEKPCHRRGGTHEGWLESEGGEQEDDCHRTRMGRKQRSVQAGLSRDSPSLSWVQSEAIQDFQQGSNITTLGHKSITQLPPWRWDWRKAKRNLGDQLGGCEGNGSELGVGVERKRGIFKVNLELWRSSCILFHNSNVHMWGENVFWKGQSTKSRDYFARIPARLISTYPIQTHTLQNTSSCF